MLASKGMILVHGYHPNTRRSHSYPYVYYYAPLCSLSVSQCSFCLPLPNCKITLHSLVWCSANVGISTKIGCRGVRVCNVLNSLLLKSIPDWPPWPLTYLRQVLKSHSVEYFDALDIEESYLLYTIAALGVSDVLNSMILKSIPNLWSLPGAPENEIDTALQNFVITDDYFQPRRPNFCESSTNGQFLQSSKKIFLFRMSLPVRTWWLTLSSRHKTNTVLFPT